MSEHFESEVQKVARTKNGGSIDAGLFWDIVIALDKDGGKRHDETLSLLDSHITEDNRRAAVIASELAEWRGRQAEECAARHRELFAEELEELPKRIRAPRRASDPKSADYRLLEDEEEGDMRRAWRVGKWFLAAGVLFLLDTLSRYFSHIFLGYPN